MGLESNLNDALTGRGDTGNHRGKTMCEDEAVNGATSKESQSCCPVAAGSSAKGFGWNTVLSIFCFRSLLPELPQDNFSCFEPSRLPYFILVALEINSMSR